MKRQEAASGATGTNGHMTTDGAGGPSEGRQGYSATGKKLGRPRARPPHDDPDAASAQNGHTKKKGKGGRPEGTGGSYTLYKDAFKPLPTERAIDEAKAIELERSIGLLISKFRMEHGYKARDIARLMEIHPTAFSAMETGRRRLTLSHLYRLASILQVDLVDLLPKKDEAPLTPASAQAFAACLQAALMDTLAEIGDVPIRWSHVPRFVELILQRLIPTGGFPETE